MSSLIERLVAGLAIVLASNVCISEVLADEPPESTLSTTETISEAIDRAATQSSLLAEGDFFKDRSLGGDAAFTFGIGYDENRLSKEAQQLGAISRDLLNQQASQDPIVRTRDLPNPYSGSLLSDTELTDIQAKPSGTGTEQPTRAIPDPEDSTETESTDSEESTESESDNTEEPSETESNDSEGSTETESNNTEDSTGNESSDSEESTESESNNTEKPSETESDDTETESESENTEDSTETKP